MNYKYYINDIEVFPNNAGTENIIFERKIASSITLEKNVDKSFSFNSKGSFNFELQEQIDSSEELSFLITEKCGNVYKIVTLLFFTIAEGNFNKDRCLYEIKPRNRSEFPTDIEVNFLLSPGMVQTIGGDVYKQTFKFGDVLFYVTSKSNPKIKGVISDFFQINPINVSADAIPGITNVWNDLRLASLSDIQYPAPTGLARIEFVTFQELFDDIYFMFRAGWFIDEDGYLRLEHESYFEGGVGLNLLQNKYKKYLNKSNEYSYDLTNLPRIEKLQIVDSGNYAQVRYTGLSDINKTNSQSAVTTKVIRTDYTKIQYGNGNSTVDGIFMFAQVSGNAHQEYLTPEYLFRNLHTYNRSDFNGFFESETLEYNPIITPALAYVNRSGGFKAKGTKPIKLQRDITIPFCCEDDLDTQKQVRTPMSDNLGDGYFDKISISLKNKTATLSLKYKVPTFKYIPSDINGLDLWLRSDGNIFNGAGKLSQWTDYSGNNRHATNANTSTTLSIDNTLNPTGVTFDGNIFNSTPKFMTIPAFQLFPNKRGTMIILFKNNGVNGTHHILSTHNTNPSDKFFDLFLVDSILIINSGDFYVPQLPYFSSFLSTLIRYEDDKIKGKWNSMDVQEFHNYGINIFNPMNVANDDISLNDIILGSNPNVGVEDSQGQSVIIQEIIIYNRALTEKEIDKIELYLVNKGNYIINKQLF